MNRKERGIWYVVGNYLEIAKTEIKHHLWKHILLSAGLLLLSPLVLGIRNLDGAQSAKVLETYVALTGILLFVPVFLPEQNRDLWDVVRARKTSITSIYLVRILLALLAGALLLLVYMKVMEAGNCQMDLPAYYFGTLAGMLAFGGSGVFAAALADNLIAGYMIPLAYYIGATGAGYRYMKKLYPFGMLEDYSTKYWILGAGIFLLLAGIFLFRRRKA